jgi:NAD dependent epimerase/dehydratase family enzyme
VNVTAPGPVTNKQFCEIAGKVLKSPCWTRVPAFALKIALGEFAGSLINGQKVIPEKIIAHGYKFKYPALEEALQSLLNR